MESMSAPVGEVRSQPECSRLPEPGLILHAKHKGDARTVCKLSGHYRIHHNATRMSSDTTEPRTTAHIYEICLSFNAKRVD